MQKTRTILHTDATAAGPGLVAVAPGIEHSFEVVVTGTGALACTVNPRWGHVVPVDPTDLASIDGPKELTGTGEIRHVYTVTGAVGAVSCPIELLTGTGASATVAYLGSV